MLELLLLLLELELSVQGLLIHPPLSESAQDEYCVALMAVHNTPIVKNNCFDV